MRASQAAQELDAQAAAGGVPPARKLCTKCLQVTPTRRVLLARCTLNMFSSLGDTLQACISIVVHDLPPQVQSADQFYRHKTNFDKRQSYCQQCTLQVNALRDVKTPTVQEKKCSRCCEVRPASSFSRNTHSHDGLESQCKDCKQVTHAQASTVALPACSYL